MNAVVAGFGGLAFVLASCLGVFAQDLAPQITLGDEPVYTPLDLKQKWLYSMGEIFGPARLAASAVHAAFDQLNDMPKQWGTSGDSMAVRLAGHFGDSFLRHNVEFAVRALDHEDPRYFRSGRHGRWNRTEDAVAHTFAVRKDDGSLMPAYSLLVTDYGAPFIVREWRPDRFRTMNGLETGTLGIGIAMGSNIFAEFWPDLKKKLPKIPFSRQR